MVCAFEWSSPTFSSQEHFQANITIITYFLKNMIDFYTASKSVFQALNIITILA